MCKTAPAWLYNTERVFFALVYSFHEAKGQCTGPGMLCQASMKLWKCPALMCRIVSEMVVGGKSEGCRCKVASGRCGIGCVEECKGVIVE